MLATAQGWIDRFGPIFLQNVFFMGIIKPQKNVGPFFLVLPPQMAVFFSEGVPGWPDFRN